MKNSLIKLRKVYRIGKYSGLFDHLNMHELYENYFKSGLKRNVTKVCILKCKKYIGEYI